MNAFVGKHVSELTSLTLLFPSMLLSAHIILGTVHLGFNCPLSEQKTRHHFRLQKLTGYLQYIRSPWAFISGFRRDLR